MYMRFGHSAEFLHAMLEGLVGQYSVFCVLSGFSRDHRLHPSDHVTST
jgi:hypothetical protein